MLFKRDKAFFTCSLFMDWHCHYNFQTYEAWNDKPK